MRSSLFFAPFGFLIASFLVVACQGQVAVDDPDTECKDPAPEVPPGAYCPPAYSCIDGEWVDTAGACPDPACPAEQPSSGDACPVVGQTCGYDEDIPCGPAGTVEAVCTEDGWLLMSHFCSPEPVCPDDMPIVGDECSDWPDAYACQYPIETACGTQYAFIDCVFSAEGAFWTLQGGPSCGVCEGYGSEADCGTDSACQWLVAGCGDPPIETGCYPKDGCDVTACADGQACVETIYDPCYGEPCDACGASYFACVSP